MSSSPPEWINLDSDQGTKFNSKTLPQNVLHGAIKTSITKIFNGFENTGHVFWLFGRV